MKSVCVYCGSSDNVDAKFIQEARNMGKALAKRKIDLVFGGGSTGLMGAVADEALNQGSKVVGVITDQFNKAELAHNGLSRLEVVENMHERKARMMELSDAFIALPGGFGTMEEFFEALTWAQIGLHRKAIGLLNAFNYFDPLLEFFAGAKKEGFIFAEHKGLFRSGSSPEVLIDDLSAYRPPEGLAAWLER